LAEADGDGAELFTTMIQELSALLIATRKVIYYDELATALKCIAVNCNYHRHKALFEHDVDKHDITAEVSSTVRLSLRDIIGMPRKTGKRAMKHLVHNYVHFIRPRIDRMTRIWSTVTEGDAGKSRKTAPADEATINRFLEVEALRHFNASTVENVVGEQFTIEEFHMALVRLSRDIGRAGKNDEMKMAPKPSVNSRMNGAMANTDTIMKTKFSCAPAVKRQVTTATLDGQHPSKFLMQQMLSEENEVCFDGGNEGEFPEPLGLDTEAATESELRVVKSQLASLRDLHADTKARHRAHLARMNSQRKDIMNRIVHQQSFKESEWEMDGDLEDDEEDHDECEVSATGESAEGDAECDEETMRIRTADHMIKEQTAKMGTGKVPCANCGNMLMIDAFFCRKCGLERGRHERDKEAKRVQNIVDQDKQLAVEDRIFALKFELNLAASELKREKEQVAALKSQLGTQLSSSAISSMNLSSQPDVGSLDNLESRQLTISHPWGAGESIDQRPKMGSDATEDSAV